VKINVTKTLTIGKKETVVKINVGQQPVQQVCELIYLGTLITRDGSCEEDVRRRIGKASGMISSLRKICRDKNISAATKPQLSEVLVILVFIHVAECWIVTREDK